MDYAYLLVEGPHDAEFVARLLKPHGFKRVGQLPDLDPYWHPLVPRKFPADDKDLLKRVPVPTFLQSATCSVALDCAIGDSRLVRALEETWTILRGAAAKLRGIAVMADADDQDPQARADALRDALRALPLPLRWPDAAGQVSAEPRCGYYVLPDNQTRGTLEALLLESAAVAFPTLLPGARAYVEDAYRTRAALRRDDRKDLEKPAGQHKAVAACVASVMRPGKAIQASIQDNAWLGPETLALPRIAAVAAFFAQILGLAPAPPVAG